MDDSFIWQYCVLCLMTVPVPTEEGKERGKRQSLLKKPRLVLHGSSMTAYLSKQQTCFADLNGRGDSGEAPYSFSWHHQPPNNHHQHQHHHLCQRYHYGPVPGGATLPRRGSRTAAWHVDSSSKRPNRLGTIRAKGASCDLWPSECDCIDSWQGHYQVKLHIR